MTCLNSRDFWYNKMKNDKLNTRVKLELNFWRWKLTEMRRTKRKKYHGKRFENANGDIKKTWKCIKEVLYNGKPPKSNIEIFSPTDADSTKTTKINEMNAHFANLGKRLIDEIDHVPFHPLTTKQLPDFQLSHTNATDVITAITKIKSSNKIPRI